MGPMDEAEIPPKEAHDADASPVALLYWAAYKPNEVMANPSLPLLALEDPVQYKLILRVCWGTLLSWAWKALSAARQRELLTVLVKEGLRHVTAEVWEYFRPEQRLFEQWVAGQEVSELWITELERSFNYARKISSQAMVLDVHFLLRHFLLAIGRLHRMGEHAHEKRSPLYLASMGIAGLIRPSEDHAGQNTAARELQEAISDLLRERINDADYSLLAGALASLVAQSK